jgi:hypothetical protein
VLFIEPSNPPFGGPKIAHSIEDSIGTIEAQIGCGAPQEIAQSENGTFSRCGVLRVEIQPSKIEIFFLKITDSIYFPTPMLFMLQQKILLPKNVHLPTS